MPLNPEKKAPVRVFSFGDLAADSGSESEEDVNDVSPSTFSRSPSPSRLPPRASVLSPSLEETESVESEDWDEPAAPVRSNRFSIAYEPDASDDEETLSDVSSPVSQRSRRASDQEYAEDEDLDDGPPRAILDYGSSEEDEEPYSDEEAYDHPVAVGQPMLAWVPASTLAPGTGFTPTGLPPYEGRQDDMIEEDMDADGDEEGEEDSSMEDAFQQTHPTVDPGKAQVMRSVFFPFPHQAVSTSPSHAPPTPSVDRPPRRLSDVDEPNAGSPRMSDLSPGTPIHAEPLPSRASFTPLWKEEAQGDTEPASVHRLFPDEIGFPPKKRFASLGGEEDAPAFRFAAADAPVSAPLEYDLALTQQRVAWEESTALPLGQTGAEENAGEQYARSLARSVRVGWGPQQMMAFQSASFALGEVTIQSAAPFTMGMEPEQAATRASHYIPLLQVHRQHNPFHERGFSFLPLSEDNASSSFTQETVVQQARTAIHELAHTAKQQAQSEQSEEEVRALARENAKTWRLMDALWGVKCLPQPDAAIPPSSEKELHDHQDPLVLHRRRLVSQWGQEALQEAVATYQAKLDKHPKPSHMADTIRNLLAGRQLRPAVDVALKAGEFRLATLLAQVTSQEMRESMKRQVEEWAPLLDKEIEPSLSRLYLLLAGHIEESVEATSCEDWLRCLFLFFWYGDASNQAPYLTGALEAYRHSDLYQSYPPTLLAGSPVRHVLYQLLEYYCWGDHPIWELVDPMAYNGFPLECSLGWMVFTLLSALQQQVYHTSSTLHAREMELHDNRLYRLTINFADQLETMGLFSWSVYVLLHLPDPTLRQRAVQHILDRNALAFLEEDVLEARPTEVERFFMEDLHLPATALSSAKACAASYLGEDMQQLAHLLRAKAKDDAHRLFVDRIGPHALLQFHLTHKCFLDARYQAVPELLRQLMALMNHGEGAYRIYANFFAALLPDLFGDYRVDDIPRIHDMVRHRLAEIKKYSSPSQIALERLCLSTVPAAVAFEQQKSQKDADRALIDMALGSRSQPMSSAAQFTFFDRLTCSQVSPA